MKQGALEPIAALNRVKIVETGEPLVDIRDFCPAVEVPDTICPYLRQTVAEMLNRAQSNLPPDHRFRIGTALRTLSMQKGGWDGYFRRVSEEHPNWPLSALRRATNRYFAPYDQPAPPGHCTGAAVDVTLLGSDGEPLDVTSPTEGWQAAYTWSDLISPDAKRNRMVMVHAMLDAGFSNCREEFWHYSWGDSAWAVRVGETRCPYGLAKAPPLVEARFAGALAGNLRQIGERTWACRGLASADGPVDGLPNGGNGTKLLLGIFWAEETEILLRIESPLPDALYRSPNRETWEPAELVHEDGALILTVTPATPRVYLASEIPPKAG